MATPAVTFGVNIDPAHDYATALRLTRLAEELGFDCALVQDHADNPRFVETWTLLAALGAATERIVLGPNVLTSPLRLPALIAKAAATLDLITGGRVLLGLGAGASPEGISALGGPALPQPRDRFRAFRDTLHIVRGLWESDGEPFSHDGQIHAVRNVRFGPLPSRRIPIITGAMGPRSLRLTAVLADGISVSTPYVSAEQLPAFRRRLDEGAREADRDPGELRMIYNVMGFIDDGSSRLRPRNPGIYWGDAAWWVERLASLVREAGVDGFIYWPVAGDYADQFRRFATDVVPAVRASLRQTAARP